MKTKILILLVLLLQNAVNSFAVSGTTGSLTWSLENGMLIISGTGAIPDYSYPNYAPWYSSRSSIIITVIEQGVTGIGNYAFLSCSGLTAVTIGNQRDKHWTKMRLL